MLLKIFMLPMVFVKTIIDLVLRIIRLFGSVVFGIVRILVSRIFGTIFGATVGFLLGNRHLGISFGKKRKNTTKK